MPRHPPNALTSRLKTRTTNDNTDVLRWPYGIQTISSVSIALALLRRSIAQWSPMPFPRHRSKKPIHNVKDEPNGQMPKVPLSPAHEVRRQTGYLILDDEIDTLDDPTGCQRR